jgi:hypothetical protein
VKPGRHVGQFHADVSPTGLGSPLAASDLDQDVPHGLGDGGEEVPTAVELLVADKTQVHLVNQRGGVETVAAGFRGQARGGELALLLVGQR